MRTFSTIFWLGWLLIVGNAAPAQEKVAEGKYEMRGRSDPESPQAKLSTQWVLYSRGTEGYHLESEVKNLPGGMRVVQVEDLDNQLIPVMMGFDLYAKNQAKPTVHLQCAVVKTTVTCSGDSDKGPVATSPAYDAHGPFVLWVKDLATLDLAWVLTGAVNMAHLQSGKTGVKALVVAGGAALVLTDKLNVAALKAAMAPNQTLTVISPEHYTEWEFDSEEETALELVGTEEVKMNGTKITATHYRLNLAEEPAHFWTTRSGLLIKMSDKKNSEYVLRNYKQYKNLVPELKVEGQTTAQPAKTK